MATRSKWQESGGKAVAAAAAATALQQKLDVHRQNSYIPDSEQSRRARGAYVGLFLLMVTVWSTILISAIFSLRVNRESCENCPAHCTCSGAPPAWGWRDFLAFHQPCQKWATLFSYLSTNILPCLLCKRIIHNCRDCSHFSRALNHSVEVALSLSLGTFTGSFERNFSPSSFLKKIH